MTDARTEVLRNANMYSVQELSAVFISSCYATDATCWPLAPAQRAPRVRVAQASSTVVLSKVVAESKRCRLCLPAAISVHSFVIAAAA